MRKYGKWLLMMAVLAAVPAVASADGIPGGLKRQAAASGSSQKQRNQQQAEQVKAALQNARIDGYGIRIEVVDGVVTLNGNVRNPGHRARAAEVCQKLPEISRVVNKLVYVPGGKVRPAAATLTDLVRGRERQSAKPAIQRVNAEAAAPSNQQIAEQIGSSLKQAGLAGMPIDIRFQNGTVTLSGNVQNPAQRNIAQQAAGRIEGVRSVNNQLQVPPAPPQLPPRQMAPQQMASQQMAPHAVPASFGQQLAGYPQPGSPAAAQMTPVSAGPAAIAGAGAYSHPHLPTHAWPAYAQYPNSAAVTYPTQYSASAFPYIGPFYPYPQVPLGWREARLQWDDGFWSLNFNKQQDVWHVLFHPWEKDH